jgi:DNA-binding NarL/FixJ family response regulator
MEDSSVSQRIPVFVYSDDSISQAGLVAQLRGRPEAYVVDELRIDEADVAIVVIDSVDAAASRAVQAVQRNGCPKVVLIVTTLDDAGLMAAVELGASGVLRRNEASAERVCAAITAAAAGDGMMAPDLLGRLLQQFGRLQRDVLAPRGVGPSGLTEREVEVLRLLADGLDTAAIAHRLAYSERTIKNVIHDVTARLNLRNRSHAVAYAVKCGLV